jgi:hypothetical protein
MPYSGGVPSNVILQTGNGQDLLTWTAVSGATNYSIQRSTDNTTWSTIGSPTVAQYTDLTCLVGTTYYYQVAAVNGTGTSTYVASSPISIVPCTPGQINLGYMRYMSQLKADMLNSQFLTLDEWNFNINQSAYELYDILISKFGDQYFLTSPVVFTTTGSASYPLPDGSTTISGSIPPALYKLAGVDCGVAVGNNAWVTLPRFNWIDRNKFVYPQLQANALGVFNLSYSVWQNQIYFIPRPASGQYIQLWYIPILTPMLQDSDMLPFSISGWSEYVIVDAAIKAALKEESYDRVNALMAQKQALYQRIEITAANRDVGQPNTISDTRSNTGFYDMGGFGGTGHGMAGW